MSGELQGTPPLPPASADRPPATLLAGSLGSALTGYRPTALKDSRNLASLQVKHRDNRNKESPEFYR